VIKDQQLHIQAGAGIVADSQPELEWQETMSKGRAIFRAVDRVRQGPENLLQGDKELIFANAGYRGAEKRDELKEIDVDEAYRGTPRKSPRFPQ
jgi:IS5 family transposase